MWRETSSDKKEDASTITIHLTAECSNQSVEHLIEELERIPGTQVWKMEKTHIRVGRIPEVFKVVPIRSMSYRDEHLILHVNKENLFPHIYIVSDERSRSGINALLRKYSTLIPSLRTVSGAASS